MSNLDLLNYICTPIMTLGAMIFILQAVGIDFPNIRKMEPSVSNNLKLAIGICVLLISWTMIGLSLYRAYHPEINVVHFPKDAVEHLAYVHGRHYINEEVKLDGMHFDECTFVNVTFVYDGTGSIEFTHNTFNTSTHLKSYSDSVSTAFNLMVGLGFIKPGISLLDQNNEPNKNVSPPTGGELIR